MTNTHLVSPRTGYQQTFQSFERTLEESNNVRWAVWDLLESISATVNLKPGRFFTVAAPLPSVVPTRVSRMLFVMSIAAAR